MRSRSLFLGGLLVPCVAAMVSLSGCASAAGDDEGGLVCETNPESASHTTSKSELHPSGIQTNAGYMNGGYLNAGYMNGGYLNTGYMNGLQVNGIQATAGYLNGVQTNGIQSNGIQTNAGYMNGVHLNGIQTNGVHLEGASANELVGALPGGSVVHGDAFVGAKLPAILADGRTIELVISAFERSADGAVAYYQIDYQGQNVCGDGVKGMFLPGAWDERAARHDDLVVSGQHITASFSCTTGVLAKCVRWGYAPWTVGADLHQTCVRMGRADYCGTGVSYTKDGTFIDIYDRESIEKPTTGDASLLFEAGWSPSGAVCVNRTRYDAKTTSGDAVMPSCWSSLPKCSSFDEAKAKGALTGNSSRIQSRTLCSAAVPAN